jgi:hypothetical protein
LTPNTLEDKNHDIPRFGDDVVWVGESLNCWGRLIFIDADGVKREVRFEKVWTEDLVVGVDGVTFCGDCLNVCEKRWDLRRRTASLIKFPSSIKRCNKLGKRRFFSKLFRFVDKLRWCLWWWWCAERVEIDGLWWIFDDFHAPVDIDESLNVIEEISAVWYNGSILLDCKRFKFVVVDNSDGCAADDGCWITPKCRRQPERNRSISVNLS